MNVLSALNSKDGKDNGIITARETTSVAEVVGLLASNDIGAVVVVDGRRKVRGILSERDIARNLSTRGVAILSLTAADLMTRSVVTCRPGDSIDQVMGLMSDRDIRHLPVVESGRLVGMLSMRDVVRERLAGAESDISSLREYIASVKVISDDGDEVISDDVVGNA
ncbi:CBS domain-containing protein [uncultured Gammaproteobacteria bacterium]